MNFIELWVKCSSLCKPRWRHYNTQTTTWQTHVYNSSGSSVAHCVNPDEGTTTHNHVKNKRLQQLWVKCSSLCKPRWRHYNTQTTTWKTHVYNSSRSSVAHCVNPDEGTTTHKQPRKNKRLQQLSVKCSSLCKPRWRHYNTQTTT